MQVVLCTLYSCKPLQLVSLAGGAELSAAHEHSMGRALVTCVMSDCGPYIWLVVVMERPIERNTSTATSREQPACVQAFKHLMVRDGARLRPLPARRTRAHCVMPRPSTRVHTHRPSVVLGLSTMGIRPALGHAPCPLRWPCWFSPVPDLGSLLGQSPNRSRARPSRRHTVLYITRRPTIRPAGALTPRPNDAAPARAHTS